MGAFDGAAELCVQIISDLHQARPEEERLLPEHTILNVNHPAVRPSGIRGVRIARADRSAGVRFDYKETDQAGRLSIVLTPAKPDSAESVGADMDLFAQGYVTISVLDGDWDAGKDLRDTVSRRLSIAGSGR